MKARGPKLYNHPNSGIIDGVDFKYIPKDPDPGFNPEHNRQVIADSIKKNDILMRKKRKTYNETLDERIDAAASFLLHLANTKYNPKTDSSNQAALKYFGRKELARLRGEEIKQQIMAELRSNAWILKD